MDRTDTLLLLCDFRVTKEPDKQAIEKIKKVVEELDAYDPDMPGLLDGVTDILIGIRRIFSDGFGLMSFMEHGALRVKYMNDDILTYREEEFEEFLSAIAPFSEGFMQFCVDGEQIVRYVAEDGVIERWVTPGYDMWIKEAI